MAVKVNKTDSLENPFIIPAALRARIEAAVERLITALDRWDGDPDREDDNEDQGVDDGWEDDKSDFEPCAAFDDAGTLSSGYLAHPTPRDRREAARAKAFIRKCRM